MGGGEWVWRWGKRGIIYLSLHCRHHNDSCIKMGSDESDFNVSLIVRDKVRRQCPQTTTFEEKGEPNRIRIALPRFFFPTLETIRTALQFNVPRFIGDESHYTHLNDRVLK